MNARPGSAAFRLAAYVLVVSGAAGCGGGHVPLPELAAAGAGDTTALVERGEYIVRSVSVCGHCHAADPEDPDGPLAGGLEFSGWRIGTIAAANLTPDSATGIGAWSDAEVVRAIRSGEHRSGGVLAPVMPYAWFNGMSDRDALAVARYLRSLDPIRNEVRRDPSLVYALAEALLLEPEEPSEEPAPPRSANAAYGGYLANHVALCADCHTPRGGLRSSPDMDRLFAGTDDPPAGFPANPSNLTPDSATGIGSWSEDDFIRTLRTGVNPAGRELHPFMPWRQLRRMSDDDVRAIYRYLRTLPPIRNEVPVRAGSGG